MRVRFSKSSVVVMLLMLVAAGGLSAPGGPGQWGSIRGNNSSAPAFHPAAPSRPAMRPAAPPPQRQPVQPSRPVQPVRPSRPVQSVPPRNPEINRGPDFNRDHRGDFNRVDVDRVRARELEHRRFDIAADRHDSFYWSRYHRGMHFHALPVNRFAFFIGGAPFYYYSGVYYAPVTDGYEVVAPPQGAVVPELPPGYEMVLAGGATYYYAAGAFYVQQADGYALVQAPLGVTVSLLPPDAIGLTINGTNYYQAYGVTYLPVMQNGVTVYMTVQPPQ